MEHKETVILRGYEQTLYALIADEESGILRPDLLKKSGMYTSTFVAVLKRLYEKNVIIKESSCRKAKGRPNTLYRINKEVEIEYE